MPATIPNSSHSPDIIVIGASAGGVEALRQIVQSLPRNLPAAVFVVLHMSRDTPSLLDVLLDGLGPLPVRNAVDGESIERGRIYLAPRDRHLSFAHGRVRVSFGPLQNRHRPSIDVLFRSAAQEFADRVIGVVLSGFLSDGSDGLLSIKRRGGIAVVQDPETAAYRDMPDSALRTVDADHVVSLKELPPLLERLTASPGKRAPAGGEESLAFETAADLGKPEVGRIENEATPSSFICPDCGGALWELNGSECPRFRCRVGHAYSLSTLVSSADRTVEAALWAAARSLEDRAALSRRLAGEWRGRNGDAVAAHFTRVAEDSSAHAAVIRSILGTPAE